MTKAKANTGWLFYKDYYRNINFRDEKANEQAFNNKNANIFKARFQADLAKDLVLGEHQFKLETTYPGMLIGSGYTHETGLLGEIKIGFFFDYTTGFPVLPGSSVKGTLRSAFPDDIPARIPNDEDNKKREKMERLNSHKIDYLQRLLERTDIDINQLRDAIFKGKGTASMYEHDIFYDAVPTAGGQLFSNDFITPHHDPLKDPTPLQFLKVLPEVQFTFSFDLHDDENGLSAEDKCKLFQQIILDLGVGAKTSVGYGAMKTYT